MWEEPCISGTNGSGTVFFSGCSLRCVYCQNREISTGISGREITDNRLADIFLELQDKGAHNINLVTGDHYAVHIYNAVKTAKKKGLSIPVLYNTSGYCKASTLKMLQGLIDIYLTDFKYADSNASKRYSSAADYFEVAKVALAEMYRQIPKCSFSDGIMQKGIIVRHLVLPNNIKNSIAVLRYLSENYGNNLYVSVMNQYTPRGNLKEYPEIMRRVTKKEYDRVLSFVEKSGLCNVYIQEGSSASESFIPPFDNQGI